MKAYPLKRLFDIIVSICVLVLASPILLVAILMVWLQDFQNPFYIARRVGRHDQDFSMIKIRSMIVDAEKSGVNSTGNNDARVTHIGQTIRRYKIDELSQFVNVLNGDMSIVGPRPNTRSWGVDLYTPEERRLLTVRPGITDFSSIVFSDEGRILANIKNPDVAYNQLIRPWKSRLGLLYIDNASLHLDLQIILATLLAIFSRKYALSKIQKTLKRLDVDPELLDICNREKTLTPAVAPGAKAPFEPNEI